MFNNSIVISSSRIFFKYINIENIENGWLDWINDHKLIEYLETSGLATKESLLEYLEKSQPPTVHMFAVYEISSGDYIGNARLYSIDYINKDATYGRLIGGKKHHGKGYGTEMLSLLSDFAFNVLKLERIYTGVNNKNIGSVKSNIKAGAVLDRVEQRVDKNGKKYNVSLFSINSRTNE